MTKQQKTYILLAAVLMIWGAIGYQIIARLNPATPDFSDNLASTTFQKKNYKPVEFYTLNDEYRDPFLGGYPKKKVTRRKKKVATPKQKIVFPSIVFNGMIGSNSSASFIITINNRQEILRIGQTINEITLVKADAKKITIKYKGELKTIEKK